jgi:DNA-binding response OmpR family regulator
MLHRRAQILVVDDEASIRLTLGALLQRLGYAATLAANGDEALAHIRQRAFDLVLLDLIMPGMDGHTVARRINALQPQATILMVTGSDAEYADVGEYQCVRKTASPQEVLNRVAAAIGRRQEGAARGPTPHASRASDAEAAITLGGEDQAPPLDRHP